MPNAAVPVVGRFVPRSDTHGAGPWSNPRVTLTLRAGYCGARRWQPLRFLVPFDSAFIFIATRIETSAEACAIYDF
jgi:hypothetical protein